METPESLTRYVDSLDREDVYQGVRLTAVAKQQPYRDDQPAWELEVVFKAHCNVCEWAATVQEMPGLNFTIGFGSSDLLRVFLWPSFHTAERAHRQAWAWLSRTRGWVS